MISLRLRAFVCMSVRTLILAQDERSSMVITSSTEPYPRKKANSRLTEPIPQHQHRQTCVCVCVGGVCGCGRVCERMYVCVSVCTCVCERMYVCLCVRACTCVCVRVHAYGWFKSGQNEARTFLRRITTGWSASSGLEADPLATVLSTGSRRRFLQYSARFDKCTAAKLHSSKSLFVLLFTLNVRAMPSQFNMS